MLTDRTAIAEARSLIARYGADAAVEAAYEAARSRRASDWRAAFRWGEIERFVLLYQLEQPVGELH